MFDEKTIPIISGDKNKIKEGVWLCVSEFDIFKDQLF